MSVLDTMSMALALERAKDFCSKVLAPLGIVVVGEATAEHIGPVGFVGFGIGQKGSLPARCFTARTSLGPSEETNIGDGIPSAS